MAKLQLCALKLAHSFQERGRRLSRPSGPPAPQSKVRVDNVFGPTEGEMTRYVCPCGRPMSTMPVGRPIDGSVVYVLGPAGQLCGPEARESVASPE